MQVTKGTWRMREQCVPGSLSSSHAREPGNEARLKLSTLIMEDNQITARKLSQLPGRLQAATRAVSLAPLFYRKLQQALQVVF